LNINISCLIFQLFYVYNLKPGSLRFPRTGFTPSLPPFVHFTPAHFAPWPSK
jgi:hypothetical protein